MGAFLGISVWVTLATVVPGLITIAVLFGALLATSPAGGTPALMPADLSDWVLAGAAVSCMVLTQALGILLESWLISGQRLGPEDIEVEIPPGIDPHGVTVFTLHPYQEYQGIYLLLAELRDTEDSQGHLKRCLAQFFLTNNTLISFLTGMVATLLLLAILDPPTVLAGWLYFAALAACLYVSFRVARIRFTVMAKSLWAARRRRLDQ